MFYAILAAMVMTYRALAEETKKAFTVGSAHLRSGVESTRHGGEHMRGPSVE
jgi:hypothetical protein